MSTMRYPTDLTPAQWKRIQDVLPSAKPGGRPRSVEVREVLNGILYVVGSGRSWRMMPKDLPPWSTCYDYYRKWREDGTWTRLSTALLTASSPSSRLGSEAEGHPFPGSGENGARRVGRRASVQGDQRLELSRRGRRPRGARRGRMAYPVIPESAPGLADPAGDGGTAPTPK